MKKLLALLLALAVSFSLAIPAFAANTALDGIEYDGYTGNNYHSGSKHYYEYADICTGCGDQKANTTTWSVINCSGPPCIDIMNVGITQ